MMQFSLFSEKEEEVRNLQLVEFNSFLQEKRMLSKIIELGYQQNPYRIGILIQDYYRELSEIVPEIEERAKALKVSRENVDAFLDLFIKRIITKEKEEKAYFVEWYGEIKIIAVLFEKQKETARIKDIKENFLDLFFVNYLFHHQEFFFQYVEKEKYIDFVMSVLRAKDPVNPLKSLKKDWYPPYSMNGFYLYSDLTMEMDLMYQNYCTEEENLPDEDFKREELEFIEIQLEEMLIKGDTDSQRFNRLLERKKKLEKLLSNLEVIKNVGGVRNERVCV